MGFRKLKPTLIPTCASESFATGGTTMDWRCVLLSNVGYQIVSVSGEYVRACRNGRDEILRWDGEDWVVL